LVFDKPGRPALGAKAAAAQLAEESRSGTLMPTAVEAVLQATGCRIKNRAQGVAIRADPT